jgi:predicted RecA/RadA family phage recombinase
MPYNRPGRSYPTVATQAWVHGLPCIEQGVPGVAVKQQEPGFGIGPAFTGVTPNVAFKAIAIGEKFLIIDKGIVQVPTVAGFAKGDTIYITTAGVLTETASGNSKFGKVVEVAGERGTPTGYVRIDLDLKSLF